MSEEQQDNKIETPTNIVPPPIAETQTFNVSTTSVLPITKEMENNFKNSAIKSFAIMRLTYNDVFGKQHYTHGFFEYDFKKNIFILCKGYNEAN